MRESGESETAYMKRRFQEAVDDESLDKIEDELREEAYKIENIRPRKSERRQELKKEVVEMASNHRMPVTVKTTEVVTPEGIMQHLLDGSNDWKLRLEGMMLLRAAQKMNRDDVAIYDSLVTAQAKALEGQLKILREAKSESEEVALKAATAVGEQVIDFMGQAMKQKADIATVANPFEGVIARMLESAMSGFMKQTLPPEAQAEMGSPGITVEKRKREG